MRVLPYKREKRGLESFIFFCQCSASESRVPSLCLEQVLGGDDVFKLNMEPGKGALTFGYQVFISAMQKCSIMLQQLQIQSGVSNAAVRLIIGGTSVSYDNKTQRLKAQYDIKYPFWKYTTFAGDTAEIFARATLSFAFSSQLVLQHVEVAVSSNAELTLNVAAQGVIRVLRHALRLDSLTSNTPPCTEYHNQVCVI